jgi:hypothetical protein
MDCTTVSVGKLTRDRLKAYRDSRDLPNMNAAIEDLMDRAGVENPQEAAQ